MNQVRVEPVDSPPREAAVLSDETPNRYWILSNGRSWSLALGQNIGDFPPEIFTAKSGTIFIGLYHGTAASVDPENGKIISQIKLFGGNIVFWIQYGDYIVADGELEMGVFQEDGRFLWKGGPGDVIETIELKGEIFEVADFSGNIGRYKALTGASPD